MDLKKYIGKTFKVKIVELLETKKYFLANIIDDENSIYIENTGDFLEEELINTNQTCVIIDVKTNHLIGFIISNRKFINDMKKIENKLKNTEEYHKIKDIYLMKRLKINGKIYGLYGIDEGDILKYYLDLNEIGIHIDNEISDRIFFKEKTIEEELKKQIKDVVNSIDIRKKEISLQKEKEKTKNIIEKELGLEIDRQITRIATISLDEKIKDREEKESNKNVLEKNLLLKNNEKKIENNIKNVNIKQEMNITDKVTDMKTLGKLLKDEGKLPQLDGKQYTKIGIIESDERDNLQKQNGEKEKVNTTRYSFIAIAKDGSVVPLDLQQDHQEGNNPRETNYQVSQNGKVEQDDVLSRFNIGNGTFAIKNGEYGEIKVYHSPKKTIGGKDLEGNKSLDRELETNNVWEIKKDERDLAGEYKTGYRSIEKSYQEAKQHEDESGEIIDDEKLEIKDVDGDLETKTHAHDNNIDYSQLASKWGYYKEGQPNSNKAKELFEQKRKENPDRETKEIIEMVTEDLEEEMPQQRGR